MDEASFEECGSQSQVPLKRFIKKVPASAGASSYKLTLPCNIVVSHLRHLINTDFEICSVDDEFSWSASIIPRRNKERNEYTLNGWKLWAESHGIMSGDQVAFELVTPRKMVLTIIKRESEQSYRTVPGTIPERYRKTFRLEEDVFVPVKTSKTSENASPAESPLSVHDIPELGGTAYDRSLDPEGLDMVWNTFADEGLGNFESTLEEADVASQEHSAVKAERPTMGATQPLSEPFSGLDLDEQPFVTAMKHPLGRQEAVALPTTSVGRSSADQSSPVLRHLRPSLADELADAFPRNHDPIRRINTMHSLLSGSSAADGFSEISHFRLERGQSMHTTHPNTPTKIISNKRDNLQARYKSFQAKLDRETKTAMRAAMGLEKCIIKITGRQNSQSNHQPHDEMFKHLSTLKANLWQLLVISISDEAS